MKIAITADVHLKEKEETPERWNALTDILNQLKKQGITNLIIAGDLFDADYHNYAQFDALCSNNNFKDISLHIIPGNHDPALKRANFTAPNIQIYENPTLLNFNQEKHNFFLVPYQQEKTMGDVLAKHKNKLEGSWILVGHGNWSGTIQSPNPVEPGIYMPLSKNNLKTYHPAATILGHIHKQIKESDYNLNYPGSPCGLDITETGERTFLTLDLTNLQLERIPVKTAVLFFDEDLIVYPVEKEDHFWEEKIQELKKLWDLEQGTEKNTVIRIKVRGYTADKRGLKKYFEKSFAEFSGWKGKKFDFSELSSSDNYELLKISEQVSERIRNLNLPEKEREPTKQEILSSAVKTIYQVS